MKALEQCFHVVMSVRLYKVALTFASARKTQVCDHSNENYRAVLSNGTCMLYKVALTFKAVDNTQVCDRSN